MRNNMTELERTLEWFKLAVPTPNNVNKRVQRGCHFEEVTEELQNLEIEYSLDSLVRTVVSRATNNMKLLSTALKKGSINLEPKDRVEDLDALIDQIVTSVGKAYMMGYDVIGALEEVNKSNFSKFKDGKPVFDENGKITKNPDTYLKPDLTPFV